MFVLTDTFNGREISRHHTLRAALVATEKHARGVSRHNGPQSFIPTIITDIETGDTIRSNGLCGPDDYAYTRTTDGGDEYGVE